MKFWAFLSALCVVLAGHAMGQSVSVDLVVDQEQYLPNEELIVKVRITNFSGQTITLGKEPNWVTFAVEGGPTRIVSRRSPPDVVGEFKLDSSSVGTRRVDVAPAFDLTRPGRYTITATVQIPQLKLAVSSRTRSFNIVAGTVLWQQDFGMPSTDPKATNSVPESRKYALIQATRDNELRLFFRLTDGVGQRTYRVFPVGPLVTFSNPTGQLDRFNNLHLLYQTGARDYRYFMINPDGIIVLRETHDLTDTRPALRMTKEGRIVVAGGARRFAASDLPPTLETSTAADAAPATQ